MRVGQTSIIVFVSKVAGSAMGFLATLFFARFLGAEILGLYTLLLTIANWLHYAAGPGVSKAMVKRISEGKEQDQYFTASALMILFLAVVLSLGIITLSSLFENYVSEFDKYTSLSVVWFIIILLFVNSFSKSVSSILNAQNRVHIRGLLQPVNIGLSSFIQVILVISGLSLLGMLTGWIVGSTVTGLIGTYWVYVRPAWPEKRHFRSLLDYAKFSWLGGLKTRAFNQVDILLLGMFVPTSLVGVYSVSWSIAKFLELFGQAISGSVFPEISQRAAQKNSQAISGLVEDALAYTGLIAIPGLIGGLFLSDRLMRLYGPEFTKGATVLILLIFATLIYSYQSQLLSTLNAIDRPEIAFRINLIFIGLNTLLNVLLIWQFGLEGAAAATAFSTIVGLGMSYYALNRLVDFQTPVREPLRQVFAALVMGFIVWILLSIVEATGVIEHNAVIVLGLVGTGALVYFFTLLVISTQFRNTVDRNLPLDIRI